MSGRNMNKKIVSVMLASIIVLALSYSLTTKVVHAQTPADAVRVNPAAIYWQYPTHVPGETFTMYINVVNVTNLMAFQVGFRFDQTALQVLSILEGGFLSNNGADFLLSFQGSIDNANGIVTAYAWTLTDPIQAKTGSGHLITVVMQINPSLWPPYSGTYPGTPVTLADLTSSPGDVCRLQLMYSDGVSDITPSSDHIYDGTFELRVTTGPPTPAAFFTISPLPPYSVNDLLSFDASGSILGWNGTHDIPLVDYKWDFGDGNVTHTASSTITHAYGAAGNYAISLIVQDADGDISAPFWRTVTILGIEVALVPTNPPPYVISTEPRINEPVLIKMNVVGGSAEAVLLRFRRQGGAWFNVSMSFNATESLWVQTIPGQVDSCTMEFFIEAIVSGIHVTSSIQTYNVKALGVGDINGDGIIDISDAAIIGANWQKIGP
jgi:hypothetical protein